MDNASPKPVPDPVAEPTVGAGFDFSSPDSPLAPYYLRVSHVLAIGLVALVTSVSTLFTLWHTDVWGHVKYGEWMAANGRVPDREPFSPWWDGRQPFTEFYTLTHLAMYHAYHLGERLAGGDELSRMAGGVEMLRGLHGLLVGLRFAVLLAVFVRLGRSWPVAVLGLVAVLFLDLSNIAILRPQGFGQVLFAMLLLPLSRDTLTRRALVLVPLLFAVWANSHGSYIAGLGLIALLLVGRVFDLLWPADGPATRPWTDLAALRLAAVLALSVLAIGMLNPYGFDYFARTLAMTRHPSLATGINEWQPIKFEWAKGWHWVLMASLVLAAATLWRARTPLPTGRLLVLLAFALGAAMQTRMVIWWAMVVPWALLPHWAGLWDRAAVRMGWEPSVPSLKKTMLVAAFCAAAFMWSPLAQWLIQGKPTPVADAVSSGTPWQIARQIEHPADPDAQWLPDLTATLRANYPEGRFGGAIMATPMQGDYLMWALAPDFAVTYAHIHLFHPDFWRDIGAICDARPGWTDLLDKYGVNLIVVEADFVPGLRQELARNPAWRIVLDEAGNPAKVQPLNRQLIAVRITPLTLPSGTP